MIRRPSEKGSVSISAIITTGALAASVVAVGAAVTTSIVPDNFDTEGRSGFCLQATFKDSPDIQSTQCVYTDTMEDDSDQGGVVTPPENTEKPDEDKPLGGSMVTKWGTGLEKEVYEDDGGYLPSGGVSEIISKSSNIEKNSYVIEPELASYKVEKCDSFALPISGAVDVLVDWGDGKKEKINNDFPTHKYDNSGPERTVTITGSFDSWGYYNKSNNLDNDIDCLTEVSSWGETGTKDISYGFYGADNLRSITGLPATATDLSYAFSGVMTNFKIHEFDTKNVEDMRNMFASARNFNQPIDFDASSVVQTISMFDTATSFNSPVNLRNTPKLTNIANMMTHATSFNNTINISDTSKVKYFDSIFFGATSFNQPIKFDTKSAVSIEGMLQGAVNFNSAVNLTNTQNIVSAKLLFSGATSFNQPINFDMPNVKDTSFMFNDAKSFNNPIKFSSNELEDISHMFKNASDFNQEINLNVAKVTDVSGLFMNATSFNQNLSSWKFNVTPDSRDYDATPSWISMYKFKI